MSSNLTAQEVFDQVVAHLRVQNSRSNGPVKLDDKEYILHRYHGVDGKKCPVGIFIPDAEYLPSMEGNSLENLANVPNMPTAFLMLLKEHFSLFKRFQSIHDHYEPEEWERMFAFTARTFRLSYQSPVAATTTQP